MPLGGRLAYLDELSPVSLGPGAENDLGYQDEDGDMSDDPTAPRMVGSEPAPPPPGLSDPDLLPEEEMEPPQEEPMELSEDIAEEGEEGFPGMGMVDPETGMDPKMMLAVQAMLGGARG